MQIYCDDRILVVNKPCCEAVQSVVDKNISLVEALEKEYGRLWIVHRLDQPVSGIMVFARTAAAAAVLSRQFGNGDVHKIYIAAVDNPPPENEGTLENYIHIPPGKRINKVFIRQDGTGGAKRAVLDYRLIHRTDRYIILKLHPKTGRKHQIRAQLAAAGCRIKGDLKYGASRSNPGGGIHLHAYSLEFRHPETGCTVSFTAPPPDDPIWNAVKGSGALTPDTE